MSDVADLVLDVVGGLAPLYRDAKDSTRRVEIIRAYDALLDVFYRREPVKRAAYMKLFFQNACPYVKHERYQ